ncbi:hypothetical protein D3C73_912290 [compost metagenome]
MTACQPADRQKRKFMQVRKPWAHDTEYLPGSECHEPFAVSADRADLGYHLDRPEMATGRGGHPGVDRLSLRPGGAGAVRAAVAQSQAASDEPSRAPDLPRAGVVPVLPQFHVFPDGEPVDPQRPGGGGVFHGHAVERVERAGVLQTENRPQRPVGRRPGVAGAGPAVLA